MAVLVRMDPLLEGELEQAAQRQGITKSQFIIAAVARALGRKNPYALMQALQAEESVKPHRSAKRATARDKPYAAATAVAELRAKLKTKHRAGSAR